MNVNYGKQKWHNCSKISSAISMQILKRQYNDCLEHFTKKGIVLKFYVLLPYANELITHSLQGQNNLFIHVKVLQAP